MALPYQCLTPLGKGTLFCAAQGTSIYTFDLDADSQVLSSWSHPSSRQPESENGKAQEAVHEDENPKQSGGDQPPSKKRKLDSENKPKAEVENQASQGGDAGAPADGQKKQKPKPAPPRPEVPFVIILTATDDGDYVIAATGDKIVWVFEHVGKGVLKESSQRSMSKRPSSISLTGDGKTILCADKFGDVYALPLIPSPTSSTSGAPVTTAAAAVPSRPAPRGANTFTVHSQRNLRALEEQRKHREKAKAGHPSQNTTTTTTTTTATASEPQQQQHDLLLGHVSMLTAIASPTVPDGDGGDSGGGARSYILTGDRDEHIRVSRGIPQAHVVETYCLGHGAFVTALLVPPRRPGALVSGGGDDALFLWDWRAGRLLARADLRGRAREAAGAGAASAAKVALSRLRSYGTGSGCYVLAVCERVPAVIIYQLRPSSLEHVQTLTIPGNPLDVAVVGGGDDDDAPPRLVVSVHAAAQPAGGEAESAGGSLLVYALEGDGERWARRGSVAAAAGTGGGASDLSPQELDKLLYTVENLRKTSFDDAEGEGEGGGLPSRDASSTPAPAQE